MNHPLHIASAIRSARSRQMDTVIDLRTFLAGKPLDVVN
jgi:hypothetical protein